MPTATTNATASDLLTPEALDAGLRMVGVDLDGVQKQKIAAFTNMLLLWNRRVNLSGISSTQAVLDKHVLDSLSVLPHVEHTTLLDLGTGAGFPGMVLAVARPKQSFLLLDSNHKKCRFLRHVKRTLQLPNVTVIQNRMEALQGAGRLQQIITRAVGSVETLWHLCRPHLAPGGKLLAMKAKVDAGILQSYAKAHRLRIDIYPLSVPPSLGARNLITIAHENSSG